MNYLLIFFIVALVLSPLVWLRSSPSQARAATFRRRALELGLKVQLKPPADASEEEKKPTAVRYLLPLGGEDLQPWTLLRNERRGSPSPWAGWRWFHCDPPEGLISSIEPLLTALPPDAEAVRVDPEGISVYWTERGNIEIVNQLHKALATVAHSIARPR